MAPRCGHVPVKKEFRILILEDRPADVKNLERALGQGRLECRLKPVESQEAFLQELERDPPDVILSDQNLRSFDGLTALAIARQQRPDIPFIFVTNPAGEEKAIASFQGGATDYILKSHLAQLAPAIERAMEKAGERAALQEQQRALRDTEELLRNQTRLAAILETALDAIIAVDRQGRIQEWNPAAQRIFGYSRGEVLGRPMDELIVPAAS